MKVCVVLCTVVLLLVVGDVIGLGTKKKLLLISFDGMRWDYMYRRPDLKSFQILQENGVRAEYLIPTYPSQTGPSHISIATGLYVESHGVVHNVFFNKSSRVDPTDDYYSTLGIPQWYETDYEPIWTTASTQGLKSGVYLYPGGNMTVNGRRASYFYHPTFEDVEVWPNRINTIMPWFRDDGFDFVATYFNQPDTIGHDVGPFSSLIAGRILPLVDNTIMQILQSVKDHGLEDELDIIIVSDHGMLLIDDDPIIDISKYVDPEEVYSKICYGAIALIEPMPGKKEKVYSDIRKANLPLQAFYKEEFPERFHYSNNDRITSIILLAHAHKVLTWNTSDPGPKGNHVGYDNTLPDMRSPFFMIGPSFKKNVTIPCFESINIYELMCKLLNLRPAPNNGSIEVFKTALLEYEGVQTSSTMSMALAFICCVSAIWAYCRIDFSRQ